MLCFLFGFRKTNYDEQMKSNNNKCCFHIDSKLKLAMDLISNRIFPLETFVSRDAKIESIFPQLISSIVVRTRLPMSTYTAVDTQLEIDVSVLV